MGALAMLLPKSAGQVFFAAARGGLLLFTKRSAFFRFQSGSNFRLAKR
jgi:hypothetical protein